MKKTFSLLLALLMVISCAVMPVTAATDIAAEDLVNLYDFYQSNGDMVADDGTVTSDATVSSNSMIPVTGGKDIYLGPYTNGTVYLAAYDADGEFIASISAVDCSVVDTLADGSVIYSYTLGADAAYVWVAAENTYAMSFMLTEDQPIDGTLIEAYHAINPLEGKKALFIGDSITHGTKDTPSDHYGWAGRIGTANNMDWTNNGQSGYSLSTCRVGRADYDTIVSKLVETKYESFDYILLHGGVNDVMDLVEIGEISEGYDPAEFNVDTFAGGLEDLIYKTYYYYGKKATIGFIVNFDLPAHKCGPNMRTYFDVAKEICEKWNVRYFDMLENTKVTADLKVSTKTYLSDTLHPNKAGYDILAPMIEGFMKTLTKTSMPGSDITDDGKVYNVTFKDDDGTVLATTTATRAGGLAEDAPAGPNKGYDGIVSNYFEGWTVDGELIDAPDAYDITSDITFTAQYAGKGYGARFEDREPVVIRDGSAPQELLPETVSLHPESTGITFVYKVEGVDSMIIADDWYIYTNDSGAKKPASQWGDSTYSLDGLSANHLDLNNGYYYIYVNQNLNGTNAKTPEILNSFSLFNPHTDRYDAATARDPKNTNTGATFQMLAVTCDNLQPTVTFHGADGEPIGSYQYKYTDIHKNLGFGTSDRAYSCQKGQLMGADDIFALTGFTTPEAPEGSILLGWTENPDAEEVVLAKAIYYNCELYPVFKTFTEDDYQEVTFVDAYGETLYTGDVLYGKLVDSDYPASADRAPDGVYVYRYRGWTIDGESIIDPSKYEFKGGEVIKPLYTVYGKVYTDPTPVTIPNDTSAEFNMLTEEVLIPTEANGITIAYKVEGVEDEIIADALKITTSKHGNPASQWSGVNNSGVKLTPGFTTDGDYPYWFELNNGYYYIYVNENLNGMNAVKNDDTLKKFSIFGTKANDYVHARTPVNTNENAQVSVLAVVSDNLQPTATFHDEQGNALASYQHKYTDVNRHLNWGNGNPNSVQEGYLLTIDETFAMAQASVAEGEAEILLPAKDSGHKEIVYEFDCWVDAEGNPVEALYYNVDLYPSFKMVDKRTQYKVEFRAYDDSLLYECVVPEGDTPVYPAEFGTPKKPSTDTNSYEFIGWSPAIEMMPETPEADGATAPDTVVYKAQYNEIERRYDVIYYAEDGITVIDEDLYLVKGTASTTDVVPEKAADVQYNYTFEGWVDLEGKKVDLTKVTSDMKVKPVFKATLNKYTVTFIDEDGESELGKSTVDYGTAATAPEATKERDEWYAYSFEKWVDEEGNEVSVTEVKGDMTVYAAYVPVFAPDAELYPDIQPPMPEWYAPAVEYVLVNGIMNGMTGGFSPDTTMSRAMVVTVLHRYMGTPDVEIPEDFANFTDNLDTESWYYDAVIWGAVNGVVNGRGNGIFDPDGNVTRQEFATILYRFSDEIMGEYMGYGRSSLSSFYDRDDIASWAHTAVKWAFATAEDVDTAGSTAYNKTQYITGAGVMNGKVIFNPKANATRAQVATMLYRYITAERIPAKS